MPMNTICTMVSGHGVTINTVCFARPMLYISLVYIIASEASFLVCSMRGFSIYINKMKKEVGMLLQKRADTSAVGIYKLYEENTH